MKKHALELIETILDRMCRACKEQPPKPDPYNGQHCHSMNCGSAPAGWNVDDRPACQVCLNRDKRKKRKKLAK